MKVEALTLKVGQLRTSKKYMINFEAAADSSLIPHSESEIEVLIVVYWTFS